MNNVSSQVIVGNVHFSKQAEENIAQVIKYKEKIKTIKDASEETEVSKETKVAALTPKTSQ